MKNKKMTRGRSLTRSGEIRNRKVWRTKRPHGMYIEVMCVRAVVGDIPIRKLWVNMER